MKKRFFLALILILAMLLSGCGAKEKESDSQESKQEENLLADAISKYPQNVQDAITNSLCIESEDGRLLTEITINELKQFGSITEMIIKSIDELPDSYSSYNTRILFQGEYYSVNWISEDNKTGKFDNSVNGDHADSVTVQDLIDFCNNTELTGKEKTPSMIFEEAMDGCPDKDCISKVDSFSSDRKFNIIIEVNNVDKFDEVLKYAAKAYQTNLGGFPVEYFSVTYSENDNIIKSWISEDGYVGIYTDMRFETYIPNYEPK